MTIFSMILLAVLVYGIIKNKKFKDIYIYMVTVTCIIDLNMFQGDFLKVSGLSVPYEVFMHCILLLFSIVALLKYKIKKRSFLQLVLFALVIVLGIIHEILIPFEEPIIYDLSQWVLYVFYNYSKVDPVVTIRSIYWGVRLFSFVFAVVVMKDHFSNEDYINVCKNVIDVTKFMLILGLFELATRMMGSDIVNVLTKTIFGAGHVSHTLIRGGFVALQGFTSEPSAYASMLMYLAILLIIESRYNKERKRIWFFLTLFLLVLSMSFTALQNVIVIVLFFFVFRQKEMNKKIAWRGIIIAIVISLVLVVGMVVLFPDYYFSKRLLNVFEELVGILNGTWRELGQVTSERIRLVSIVENFKWFLKRPLFGLGFGVTISYGGIVSALANIGIVGYILWWKILLLPDYQNRNMKNEYILDVIAVILPNIFTGTISILYMMFIALIVALLKNEKAPIVKCEGND